MIIKIDNRESGLLQQIQNLVANIPIFKQIIINCQALPIADIIICDDTEEKIVIERKTVNDLLSSIKDGRYEEQSYRLNGLSMHNHNIVYLIEGTIGNSTNRFKSNASNSTEKITFYSAMLSLNYYKGFSVFRSFSLEETALIICNMAYKLEKSALTKKPFYPNTCLSLPLPAISLDLDPKLEDFEQNATEKEEPEHLQNEKAQNEKAQNEKDYVSVIKKIKKENITVDNIGEIMLCQIPGVSSVTALAVMEKYKSLPNLIKELDANNDCLKDITTTTKGQSRKISKTIISNIVKFLLKK